MKVLQADTRSILVLLVLLAAGIAFAQQDGADREPISVGLTEQVDVELVLVDFLVLDGRGRNVPGLTVDDFKLKVGGRKTPIASVDVDCRTGDLDVAGDSADFEAPADPAAEPLRIVLAFDYFHITNVAETLDRALAMLDRWPRGDEIHTVISLGRSVRVEAPPTRDLGDVRWALQRMRSDPDLYAENLTSLTQYRFFDRMKALFDLVSQTPGRKSIVLFSGEFRPDSFLHDPEYTELSGLSTATRTSIYPVDVIGQRVANPDFDEIARPLGGPPELRRLANNTGGRVTADTNDIGLAYARARNDLACTYTLGFYNTRPRLDKKRRLTIKIKRPDTRVVYPEFYLKRSVEEQNRSLFATATMAPHMFESEQVTTDLFILGPASPSQWRAVMAVEIDLPPAQADGSSELRGFLRKPNGTIVYDFKKKIPRSAGDTTGKVSFFQDLEIDPGRYFVSAVLSDPVKGKPLAATRSIRLVRVPNGSPFLIGPILGREAEPATARRRDRNDDRVDFEPLLGKEAALGQALQSLTLICVAGADSPIDVTEIERSVAGIDGAAITGYRTETLELPGPGKTYCHPLVDSLETSTLAPGRYELSASASTADQRLEGTAVEFTVGPEPE